VLATLAAIVAPAVEASYGVACFNVFGWEDASAVVDAASELGAPVVLAVNRDLRRFMPIEVICPMLRTLAVRAPVSVGVHLDHTDDISEALNAVDLGFTSVMYDGSQLALEENIERTRRVADYAHVRGCSIEAEIGSVPYAEGRPHVEAELTEVSDAIRIAGECAIDALAVSVGNVHRLREPGSVIDYARLAEIESAVRVPLVIHGTSGIFEEDIRRLARTRVAKFNIGTVLRQAFGAGLKATLARHPDRFDRPEIMREVMPFIASEAKRMIRLLGWSAGAHS